MNFKLLSWLSVAVLALSVAAADSKDITSLQIDTTYKPDDCTVTAQKGDSIKVHYTGTLYENGKKFDSSLDRGQPLALRLGVGQVIKGWDDGLVGMCLHEKRTLTIPDNQAYGSRGAGGLIPPNAALVFTTELVELNGKTSHEEL
ncbi:hypothetical protein EUX98_g7423 [Antrodiella citrinella]|uniref:peptidylprolyl isomerase n=1 Tax=Antrodiella citrinella TaxID=2447956 RepID=A0A4S4MLK5_9APHY|nr:hypothetical protein EUX98_g7423 [Antrodiella citrinella]